MDFNNLEAFVAVVDEGSFSNAAARLQISQSMVTIYVRNLESELGTRLINRTTRTMELTSDGQTYYYYARQMLKLNRDSMFALSRADSGERTINIVATPYTSRYYHSGRIAEFARSHPDVGFNITVCYNSEIAPKLRAGGFQFAFSNTKIMDSEYAVKKYSSASLVIITPNEERFRALAGKPFPKELFLSERVITRSSSSALQQEFLRWVKQQLPDTKLQVAAAIDDTETMKQLVAEGIGISVLSEVAVREMVARGQLLSFPLEGIMPQPLYFVSKKKLLSPVQIEFRDFILSSAEQEN